MASESYSQGGGTAENASLRPLSSQEISRLIEQGCSCPDFSRIEVVEGFDAARETRKLETRGRN